MKALVCFANVDRLLVEVMAAGLVLGCWLSFAAKRLDLPVLAATVKGQGAGLESYRRRDRQDRDCGPGPGREPEAGHRSRP